MNKLFPDSDPIEEFGTSIKDYLDMRKQDTKLNIVEYLSILSARIISFFIILIIGTIAVSFFASAASQWISEATGNEFLGAIIIGGVFLLVFTLIIIFRKKLFINSMVKMFIEIFFDNKKYGKK